MSNFDLGALLAKTNGMKFPAAQVPNADVNTLDDYEEGTFVPTFSFVGGVVGLAYTSSGSYTKIGNRVFFRANVTLSNKGSSVGNIGIGGLPFTVAENVACSVYCEGMASISGMVMALLVGGSANITPYHLGTGTPTNLTNANCTNATSFVFSGHFSV